MNLTNHEQWKAFLKTFTVGEVEARISSAKSEVRDLNSEIVALGVIKEAMIKRDAKKAELEKLDGVPTDCEVEAAIARVNGEGVSVNGGLVT